MPHSSVSVLDGSTFVVSDRRGDIRPGAELPPHGFFADDTRYLSHWQLTVEGEETDTLSMAHLDYFSAQFFLVRSTPEFHSASPVGIVRQRLVGDDWHEDLVVVNHRAEPVEVALELAADADFADLFEVKDNQVRERHVTAEIDDRRLQLRYRCGAFSQTTSITVSEDADVAERSIGLRLALGPHEEHRVSLHIAAVSSWHPRDRRRTAATGGGWQSLQQRRARVEAWLSDAPALQTDADGLRHAYRRSLDDLAALRFYPHADVGPGGLPAAGLPWFMTLFGRDSLITSFQALPYRPQLARTTLTTLAARQGTVCDDFRDEEPGKILHEVRFGELTATGERPHSPYYGSADATPLFLVLLDEHARWTGDLGLARRLEPNARAALEWIDRHGDGDGDGYVEYATRNPPLGLVNQCWKDSWNSILFADGTLARGPVAACEIQGYVYDARRRAARLARDAWDDPALAARLDAQADALQARFLEDFWLRERGCFALALDGDKRPVDSRCSNMGHLLWSGIVDDARAELVARDLMSDAMYSGWGVRTMATTEAGYNPVEYHNGTVWPHDNSLIAAGLARYGHHDAAARIAADTVRAAGFFEHRLPEVFAGCDKRLTEAPVEYPTASSPQAWAAGAVLLLLTTVLGLEPTRSGLEVEPHLPSDFGAVTLTGIHGPHGRVDAVASGVQHAVT